MLIYSIVDELIVFKITRKQLTIVCANSHNFSHLWLNLLRLNHLPIDWVSVIIYTNID